MKLTPDDPRLTAYALGELEETERAAIEAELEKSFACQRAVEEIREAAKLLETNLATEELPDLTFAQQRKIESQLRKSEARPRSFVWKILFYGGLGATACLIAAMLLPALASAKRKAQTHQLALTTDNNSRPPAQEKVQPAAKQGSEFNSDGSKPEAPGFEHNWSTTTQTAPKPGEVASSAGTLSLVTKAPNVPVEALGNVNGHGSQLAQVMDLSGGYSGNSTIPSRKIENSFTPPAGRLAGDYDFLGDTTEPNNLSEEYLGKRVVLESESRASTATYPHLVENAFLTAQNHPLSTFSIDVDTASYANVRRFLNEGRRPPREAVRIEEMVNYFRYDYPQPRGEDPFSANIEIAGCPWNSEHRLVRVALKGREIARDKRPPSNFVFLIDVSGSMQPQERLPLIKQALRQLVKKMTENDRVAIVVYASAAGIKLESTSCAQKEKILQAIDELGAGGSTAGAAGIQAAYEVAQENFIKDGVNRVLLCTDGDFNVGITDQGQLVKMIQDKAKSGVFLTTLGVGTDNYKDALMQKLADKGNGNYAYLDTLEEAQKVLIEQMSGTLVTIAKDVKIQIEFNPARVGAYRLIGYEKRMLRKEDFNNDKKDAGEIGAGHTVTALYEIVPPGEEVRQPQGEVDALKYQQPAEEKPERYATTNSRELLTLKLRYKQPDGNKSKLLEVPVTDGGKSFARASTDFKFATAVAEFGMLLRASEFKGNSSFGAVLELAEEAKGADTEGYRSEFLNLVRKARELQR